MDDQGQKIVFLAKALLDANAADTQATKKKPSISMSFKALCLTTLLAAAGGSAVTTAIHQNQQRPLNRYEKFELQALVFYAAKIHHVSEEEIMREATQKTGVAGPDDLTAQDFPLVREYLCQKAQ